jgi:hypothetical protein
LDEVEISKCAKQNMERNRHDCEDYLSQDDQDKRKLSKDRQQSLP